MKSLLITFGCSWTYGVGVLYKNGMSEREYKKGYLDESAANNYSFRALLADRHQMDHKNFSLHGSSNQAQFRQARDYFGSQVFVEDRRKYKKIVVLWGITSTARNEFYFNEGDFRRSFFYHHTDVPVAKQMLLNHYDHDHELDQLSSSIRFYNKFFDLVGIDNLWFDTFNHHSYDSTPLVKKKQGIYEENAGGDWPTWDNFLSRNFTGIKPEVVIEVTDDHWYFADTELIVNQRFLNYSDTPRDLLHTMAQQEGYNLTDSAYHLSNWTKDSKIVDFLCEHDLLNPISLHPTKTGHDHISRMFDSYITSVLNK